MDSLSIALQIPSICKIATIECLKCIQRSFICGKTALYCISEIRLFALSMAGSEDGHTEIFGFLHDLGIVCLQPLFLSEVTLRDAEQFAYCIELLPVLLVTCNAVESKISSANIAMRKHVDLVESVFFATWHHSVFLSICNFLCDIFGYLNSQQLTEFNVSICSQYQSLLLFQIYTFIAL
jgi:hypothetical protein